MAEALDANEIRAEALLYVGGAKYELDQPSGSTTCARAWPSRSRSTPLHRSPARSTTSRSSSAKTATSRSRSIWRTKHSRWLSASECAHQCSSCEAPCRFSCMSGDDGTRRSQRSEAFLADSVQGGNEISSRLARALIRLGRDDPAGALADTERAVAAARASMAVLPKYPSYSVHAYVWQRRARSKPHVKQRSNWLPCARRTRTRPLRRRRHRTVDVGAGRAARRDAGSDGHRPTHAVAGCGRSGAAGDWGRAAEIYEECGSELSVAFAKLQAGSDARRAGGSRLLPVGRRATPCPPGRSPAGRDRLDGTREQRRLGPTVPVHEAAQVIEQPVADRPALARLPVVAVAPTRLAQEL